MFERVVFFVAAMIYSLVTEESGIPDYHRIGEPIASLPCRHEVEDNNCDPVVLTKERIIKKAKK